MIWLFKSRNRGIYDSQVRCLHQLADPESKVQLPIVIAGELANIILSLMDMDKGELQNVQVKLEEERL